MSVLIIQGNHANRPGRLARHMPAIGLKRVAARLSGLNIRSIEVNPNGLFFNGCNLKVPSSRFTALRLRGLGVKQILLDEPVTLEMFRDLAGSKIITEFSVKRGEANTTCVDLEHQAGEIDFVSHPLAEKPLILEVINKEGVEPAIILAGVRNLAKKKQLVLSELTPRAMMVCVAAIKDRSVLLHIANNYEDAEIKRKAIQRAAKIRPLSLAELDSMQSSVLADIHEVLPKDSVEAQRLVSWRLSGELFSLIGKYDRLAPKYMKALWTALNSGVIGEGDVYRVAKKKRIGGAGQEEIDEIKRLIAVGKRQIRYVIYNYIDGLSPTDVARIYWELPKELHDFIIDRIVRDLEKPYKEEDHIYAVYHVVLMDSEALKVPEVAAAVDGYLENTGTAKA